MTDLDDAALAAQARALIEDLDASGVAPADTLVERVSNLILLYAERQRQLAAELTAARLDALQAAIDRADRLLAQTEPPDEESPSRG